MPTYEYECSRCGHTFEAFQSMREAPLTDCPSCAAAGSVKRLIGAGAGLIFKGSGFYVTDYKNGKSGGAKEQSDSAKSETKSESKSETKPESGGCGASCACHPKS